MFFDGIEKKIKLLYLEDPKIGEYYFEPVNQLHKKDTRPVVNDELKEFQFNDINLMRKNLDLTEEEIKSIADRNRPKDSVKENILGDHKKSKIQDSEFILETERKDEGNNKYKSKFSTFDVPTVSIEVSDINNTWDVWLKSILSNIFIQMKSRLGERMTLWDLMKKCKLLQY